MADETGRADEHADREVRAHSARRRLADEPQQRGHPQRAQDEADEAAEQTDDRARDAPPPGYRAVVRRRPRRGVGRRQRRRSIPL